MKQEGNKIIADKDKILWCIYLDSNYGKEVSLGYMYYDKNNKLLDKPYLLTEKDFKEINEHNVLIEGVEYDYSGMSYGEIKSSVVKLKYSYDDQIALILNYNNNPNKYKEKYDAMEDWRKFASKIASMYNQ